MFKGVFISFIILLFLSTYSWSAELEVSPESLNFGYVPVGSSKTLSLTVKNKTGGAVDLQISSSDQDFQVSPQAVNNLANNAETNIVVVFTPSTPKKYYATVILNAGTFAQSVTVTGSSISQPKMSLSPTSVDFGTVYMGQRKTVTITIKNEGDIALNNVRLSTSSGEFTVTPETISSIAPTTQVTVSVTFIPPTQGNFYGDLFVVSDEISASVPLQAVVPYTTGLSVSPLSIDFGVVPVGSSKTENIVVENTGSGTIKGNIVFPANLGISVSPENFNLRAGQKTNVNITFAPTQSGSYAAVVAVISDDKLSPRIEVSFKGETSSDLSYIKTIPSSLSFGYVKAGSSKEKYFRIVNTTSSALSVTASMGQNNNFTLLDRSFTVAPGETRLITVKFTPTEEKYYQDVITLNAGGKTYYMSVSGFGEHGYVNVPEPVAPPDISSSGNKGGGGGCSIAGTIEERKAGFGNFLAMLAFPFVLLIRKVVKVLVN